MGYHIEYDLMKIKKTKLKREVPIWTKGVLLAIAMIAGHFIITVLLTIFAGQWQETVAASEHMVNALKDGSTMHEAVQVFCSELLP